MSNRGLIYGIIAYGLWGVLPIYWKMLKTVGASEILVHRIIWSLIFLAVILSIRKQWSWVRGIFSYKSTLVYLFSAAFLLSINWFIYIWAVNAGFVIETSLGYFINPLVNVLLGTLFLQERLRAGQWVAVSIAVAGVAYLTASYGSLPWIALSLAISFGLYGFIKKKVRLGSAESLTAEMSILTLPALIVMLYMGISGKSAVSTSTPLTILLLIGSGIVTATPLVFFAAAARRVPLSTLGVLQYLAPTLQFLIGVYIFGESFTMQSLFGFSLIWLALATFTIEGVWQRRSHNPVPVKN